MKANLPFVGSSPDEVEQWMQVERINLYPETAPDGRSPVILRTRPGLSLVLQGMGGPVRGARVMGDLLYVVAGERLFSVDSNYNRTNLGSVLGSDRVGLADFFVPDSSRQLAIGTGERGYIYDTVTGLTEIVDAVFVQYSTKRTPVFLGGYLFWDTGDGMLWSDLLGFTTYPALNVRTAETVPDGVVGLAEVYGDIWTLGTRSIEVVRLTGQANEDAVSLAQTIDYGVAGPYSNAKADNGFYFLEAKGRVYKANGFTPQRVSTHQIEQWLSTITLSEAFMLSFVFKGHEFVCLTVPESKTECFDIATQVWSRWKSKDIERWKVNAHAFFNGENIFGDYNLGRLRKLDPMFVGEGNGLPFGGTDEELTRELVTTYIHNQGGPLFIHNLSVIVQSGQADQTGGAYETDPQMEMRYRDLYPDARWSTWKQRPIGKIGEYGKRVEFWRLGRTRQRRFHIRISDPIRCDFIAATIEGEA